MTPRAKLFISSPDCDGAFGDGKWVLLIAVKKHGSISKAAAELGRSYRKAWGDIKRAEEALGRPLVARVRGGSGGGQSVLTDFCEKLLSAWGNYRQRVHESLEVAYARHLRSVLGQAGAEDGTRNVNLARKRTV